MQWNNSNSERALKCTLRCSSSSSSSSSIFLCSFIFVVMACRAQARKHRQKMYFTMPLTYTIYIFFKYSFRSSFCGKTKLFHAMPSFFIFFHFKIAPKMHKMALVAFNAYVCTCFDSNIAMTGSFYIFFFSLSFSVLYPSLNALFYVYNIIFYFGAFCGAKLVV